MLLLVALAATEAKWVGGGTFFSGMSRESIRKHFGLLPLSEHEIQSMRSEFPSPFETPNTKSSAPIPASFSSEAKWGSCIHPILDQGQCGSW